MNLSPCNLYTVPTYDIINEILETPQISAGQGIILGKSRAGREIRGFRLGNGERKISLIGGCHADEPVGPKLLRHLTAYLSELPESSPLLCEYDWWILPHINPDGEAKNQTWFSIQEPISISDYLRNAVREQPGDDIEFGFPKNEQDSTARPENIALSKWWETDPSPFHLHASLHGMAFAAGPWFLIDPMWTERSTNLIAQCKERVGFLGYHLHDVERLGEKGFFRIEKGFCTTPSSQGIQEFFIAQSDPETAEKFRPSSMETIRNFGGAPLTLVTEMPMFITPGAGTTLGPPDPIAEKWKKQIEDWKARLAKGEKAEQIDSEAASLGLVQMPILDQMRLQWQMIVAGITN